jgi:membrane-bound lytic murein transglycosylase D
MFYKYKINLSRKDHVKWSFRIFRNMPNLNKNLLLYFLLAVFQLVKGGELSSSSESDEFDRNSLITKVYRYKKIISEVPDSVLEERFRRLKEVSDVPISLTPSVKKEIRKLLKSSPRNLALWLGKSEFYFPIFEEVLIQNDLPRAFKHLPVLESGLNPKALSNRGATGLWQFMYHTGKENGLAINSYIDERSDPIKSTEAASKYFKRLYNNYGDWLLSLAAYNSGPGNVNKAIKLASGKRDYWAIQKYLPKETQYYIPKFIALFYIFHFSEDHAIEIHPPRYDYYQTEKVMVDYYLPLKFVSDVLDVSLEDLQFLNPAYKLKIVPGSKEKQYSLLLPVSKMNEWLDSQKDLPKKLSAYEEKLRKPYPKLKKLKEYQVGSGNRKVYTVKSGDILGKIAQLYDVKVKQIQGWNNMRSTRLKIGQKLIIYTK